MPINHGSIEELTTIRNEIEELLKQAAECERVADDLMKVYPDIQKALNESGSSARQRRGGSAAKSLSEQNSGLSYAELHAQQEFVKLWHKGLEIHEKIQELEGEYEKKKETQP